MRTNFHVNPGGQGSAGFTSYAGNTGNAKTDDSVLAPWSLTGTARRITWTAVTNPAGDIGIIIADAMDAFPVGTVLTVVFSWRASAGPVAAPAAYSGSGGIVSVDRSRSTDTTAVADTTYTDWVTFRSNNTADRTYASNSRAVLGAKPTKVGDFVEVTDIYVYEGSYDPSKTFFFGGTPDSAGKNYEWLGVAYQSFSTETMVRARDTLTLNVLPSPSYVRTYYLKQASTLSAPAAPTTNPPPAPWTTVEPAYSEGSTDTLYTVMVTAYGSVSFEYGPVQKSSAYEASRAAYNLAKSVQDTIPDLQTKIISNGNHIMGHDIAQYYYHASSVTENIVIQTTVPATAKMVQMKIHGYNYSAQRSDIDLTVQCYVFSTNNVTQRVASSVGSAPVTVRYGLGTDQKLAIIISPPPGNWQYTHLTIVEASVSYSGTSVAMLKDWTMTRMTETDVTANFPYLVLPQYFRDLEETNTLTQGWRATGKTTINGGKIEADSVGAVQISANSIAAKHMIIGDFANYWTDPDFLYITGYSPWVRVVTNGVAGLEMTGTGVQRGAYYSSMDFSVTPGEQFMISANRINLVGGVGAGASIYLDILSAAGTRVQLLNVPINDEGINRGEIVVPAGGARIRAGFYLQSTATSASKIRLEQVRFRKMEAGDLIVDGSLIVDKLHPDVGKSLQLSSNDDIVLLTGAVGSAQDTADSAARIAGTAALTADEATTAAQNAGNAAKTAQDTADKAGTDLKATDAKVEEQRRYYKFTNDQGLIIGIPGTSVNPETGIVEPNAQLQLDNRAIRMHQAGKVVSYWEGTVMHVTRFEGKVVHLGKHQFEATPDGLGTYIKAL